MSDPCPDLGTLVIHDVTQIRLDCTTCGFAEDLHYGANVADVLLAEVHHIESETGIGPMWRRSS